MDITGKWRAMYRYGGGYDLPEFDQKVEHTAFLQPSEEGFEGYTENEKGHGAVPEQAALRAVVEEDFFVKMLKTYPKSYWIEKDGNAVAHSDEEFHVLYEGYIDEEHGKMYGEWSIQTVYKEEDGTETESIVFGTWVWWREE